MIYPTRPKKSLGQNFLIDKNIINKITNIIGFKKNKNFLEIGPGYGALTEKIANLKPKKLYAIEKDKKIAEILKKKFNNFKNIEIVNDDILNIINEKKLEKDFIIFGNLPYNISIKVLTSLIMFKNWPPLYNRLIFMFQKEVAERITAKKNTKSFGRLSVLCNWRLEIKKEFNISKNCFHPVPKVDSTILSFTPKKNISYKIKNPKYLETVTRILFSNRRKMINKNFRKLFTNSFVVADHLGLDLNKRPGELSNEMFYKISLKYEKLFN
tara:strand:+ start:127 stop:933 length:807 start_codon:yes stop_codon:yes gene_type:complete